MPSGFPACLHKRLHERRLRGPLLPHGKRAGDRGRALTRLSDIGQNPFPGPRAAIRAGVRVLLWFVLGCLLILAPATAVETVDDAPDVEALLAREDLRPLLKPVAAPAGSAEIAMKIGGRQIVLALPERTDKPVLWQVLVMRTGPAGKTSPENGPPARDGDRQRRPVRLVRLFLGQPGIAGAGTRPLAVPPTIVQAAASEGVRIMGRDVRSLHLLLPDGPGVVAVAFVPSGPLVRPVQLQPLAGSGPARMTDVAFAGLMLGMTLLLAVSLAVMHILRPMPELPALMVMSGGAALFVFINGGLAEAGSGGRLPPALLERLELGAEGLLLMGLAMWVNARLLARSDNRKAQRSLSFHSWLKTWLLPFGTGLVVLAALAFPAEGALLVRGSFLPFTLMALWSSWQARRRQHHEPQLVTFILLATWVAGATAALTGWLPARTADMGLSAGLVVIMVSLGTGALQAVMAPGAMLRRLLDDAGRRALAVKAAGLAVWDLDLETGALFVSEDLSRQLGLGEEALEGEAAQSRFRELVHPMDIAAYNLALLAVREHGGRLSLPLRLRTADGRYRWFLLEARALRPAEAVRPPLRISGVLMDITAARRTEERLLSDAVRDRLTGLPNRPLFMDRLSRALVRLEAQDDSGRLTAAAPHLYLIDIDRFRSINDAWGHDAGDAVLREVARRLGRFAGRTDTLARLGGDQFAMILDLSHVDADSVTLARRIQRALAVPIEVDVHDVRVTASIGIARLDPTCQTPEDMLRRAEIALFAAREAGPGQVALFTREMLGDRTRLVTLEQDLRAALSRGEMELVYQPIMHVETGAIAGFEALVRWDHPELGPVQPDAFVPLAEELGLIGELTDVVLEKAVRDLGVWQRAFRTAGSLYVAVNITSLALLNTDFARRLKALLEREDIAPETLRLELTEATILQDPERGRRMVEMLADMGVRVACDDFGTGYSSLAIIRDLPFSTLKLDRSLFVSEVDALRAAIILRSIVDMAHALDMEVVAEGIETAEQLALVRDLGCDFAQGWHVARPMTARKVTETLTRLALDLSDHERLTRFRDFLDALNGDGRARRPSQLSGRG